MLFSAIYKSPMGEILLKSDGSNICGIRFQGRAAPTADLSGEAHANLPIFDQAREWLGSYFAGERPKISALPLAPRGSAFRLEVWKRLMEIPYGQTVSYGEIAREIASRRASGRMSAQAVGGAVGHNPIFIVIPCHRVIGAKGDLIGYAAGLHIKLKLLAHEGADISRFSLEHFALETNPV